MREEEFTPCQKSTTFASSVLGSTSLRFDTSHPSVLEQGPTCGKEWGWGCIGMGYPNGGGGTGAKKKGIAGTGTGGEGATLNANCAGGGLNMGMGAMCRETGFAIAVSSIFRDSEPPLDARPEVTMSVGTRAKADALRGQVIRPQSGQPFPASSIFGLAVDLLGGFSVGNVKLERPGASALLGTKEEAKGLAAWRAWPRAIRRSHCCW
ncbi:hypothetical protein FA13DRAFT_1783842 [Coprinellus micaceus]|uniref:Uncharacterized protein n=1 Tax=Coprinellus micaceus TaxID=71717 RepID=A0A4Y7R8X8_COPMI|nr:hypothetical protein FA13DRAFT_1783842 [Coprinellus micaceus]